MDDTITFPFMKTPLRVVLQGGVLEGRKAVECPDKNRRMSDLYKQGQKSGENFIDELRIGLFKKTGIE